MFYPWTYGRVWGMATKEWALDSTTVGRSKVRKGWEASWSWMEQNDWIFWIKP
jgi:hypothetical protein